jgi:hypothetical protein
MIDHLSYSQIAEYRRCGRLAFFRRYDKSAPKYPVPARMHQGTAYDKGVSVGLAEKAVNGHEPNETAMTDAFIQTLQNPDREVDWTEDNPREAESNGLGLVRLYRSVMIPDIMPIRVQEKHAVIFKNRPWSMIVVPDCEAEDANQKSVIIDHKRSGKAPKPDSARSSEQLTAYSVAWQSRTGSLPSLVRLDYALAYKGTPDDVNKFSAITRSASGGTLGIMSLESNRDEAALRRYLQIMESVAVNLQASLDGKIEWQFAAPDSWWCSPKWCEYWDYCHQN